MNCESCKKEIVVAFGRGRFCSSSCAHRRVLSAATKEKIRSSLKGRRVGAALSRMRDKIKKECPICNKNFFVSECKKDKIYCTKKCFVLDSKGNFCKRAAGGFRIGSGRAKTGYYKGIYCGSTYELAYLIWSIDHKIPIERCTEKFSYIDSFGIKRTYLPDFIVNGESLVEIKGYLTEDSKLKFNSIPNSRKKILVTKTEILPYIKYVSEQYDVLKNKLYSLYDEHKPKYNYICSHCKNKFPTETKRLTNDIFCSRICAGKYMAYGSINPKSGMEGRTSKTSRWGHREEVKKAAKKLRRQVDKKVSNENI